MKAQNEKQALLNFIDSLKRMKLSEFNNATIVLSDRRLGRRYAIGITKEQTMSDGKLYQYDTPITDFLTYSEMNQFLRGYLFKSRNDFDIYK
jgi:hypothetical protein